MEESTTPTSQTHPHSKSISHTKYTGTQIWLFILCSVVFNSTSKSQPDRDRVVDKC